MSARARGGGRRGGHAEGHEDGERWLLTYADMITLLMALFMVLFSMSSVNTSKYAALKSSLSEAFSGKVLPGGESIMESGGSDAVPKQMPIENLPIRRANAAKESADLASLEARVTSIAKAKGIDSQVSAHVERRGLVIDILTDKLLFDSGSATVKAPGAELLASVGGVLAREGAHDVTVEGFTDDQPIASSAYPSNWELSTARASVVVRALMAAKVAPQRLTASGRAALDPKASNATAEGRSRNRRVQIVLPRESASPAASQTSSPNAAGAAARSVKPSPIQIAPGSNP